MASLGTLQRMVVNPGKPILVVEDDAESLGALVGALSDGGYVVLEARNGREALDLLMSPDEVVPSLIVLDLELPIVSGWEFLAIIRSYYRLSGIPIVVVSGSDEAPEAVRYGALAAYLRKPIEPDQLLATVHKLAA